MYHIKAIHSVCLIFCEGKRITIAFALKPRLSHQGIPESWRLCDPWQLQMKAYSENAETSYDS